MSTPGSTSSRKGLAVAVLVCASVVAGAGLRDRPARAPAPTRVAVVDIFKVQDASQEFKTARNHLEQFKADAQKKLDLLRSQIEKNRKDLDAMAGKRDSDLLGQQVELTAQGEARKRVLQVTYDEEQGRALRSNYLHIVEAIQKVASQEGWDLVLRDDRGVPLPEMVPDNNGEAHPIRGQEVLQRIDLRSVMCAINPVDITQSVINQLNNDFAAAKK